MIAELHAHSHYSRGRRVVHEGLCSPKAMVEYAKHIGLDALAITDHDSFSGCKEAKSYGKRHGIAVIAGEEISTKDGHLNALGITEKIKPGMGFLETIDEIHSQGGIAVAVHPFDIKNEGLRIKSSRADVIEAFNGLSIERTSNLRNARFALHENKPIINGSDAHCLEMMGWATTEIDAQDGDSALRAIRKGKTKLHNEYVPVNIITSWTIKRLDLSYAEILAYINENYRFPKKIICKEMLKLVRQSPGKVDYMFNLMAYFGMGNAVLYGACKEIIGW